MLAAAAAAAAAAPQLGSRFCSAAGLRRSLCITGGGAAAVVPSPACSLRAKRLQFRHLPAKGATVSFTRLPDFTKQLG